MTEIKTLFLLCIPAAKLGQVIERFDDFQKAHYGLRYQRPFYLEERQPDVIDAPLALEEAEMETLREMSRPPNNQERLD